MVKIIGIILCILISIGVIEYFFLMTHTQIIVGFIQKASSETGIDISTLGTGARND